MSEQSIAQVLPKPKTEYVLCIPKRELPKEIVGTTIAMKCQISLILDLCGTWSFLERSIAETDEYWKQLIPYVVLQTTDGSMTGVYRRAGSEKRLHGLYSIGVGGHINPILDDSKLVKKALNTIYVNIQRELNEEFIKHPNCAVAEFEGLINHEGDSVGRVHLGMLFVIKTDTPDAYVPDTEISTFKWVPTKDLTTYDLEVWSSLALRLLLNPEQINEPGVVLYCDGKDKKTGFNHGQNVEDVFIAARSIFNKGCNVMIQHMPGKLTVLLVDDKEFRVQ